MIRAPASVRAGGSGGEIATVGGLKRPSVNQVAGDEMSRSHFAPIGS